MSTDDLIVAELLNREELNQPLILVAAEDLDYYTSDHPFGPNATVFEVRHAPPVFIPPVIRPMYWPEGAEL